LFNQQSPNGYWVINAQNITTSPFDFSKKTALIIHGFADSFQSPFLSNLRLAYLNKENVNLIMVDWSRGAGAPNYFGALGNARPCGERVGEFLRQARINSKSVHCMGHSLGAHICGFAGKVSKLRRISGLDPAGPGFRKKTARDRLDREDADYVDNIHTDSWYGIQEPIGHKDFYPEGGKRMPGCKLNLGENIFKNFNPSLAVACSHFRAIEFYTESVLSKCRYTSFGCPNYAEFEIGKCGSCPINCPQMGYNSDKIPASGTFFLHVKENAPFCMY